MAALLTKNLGVICPSCDFLNVVGAVRCMACGSATEGTAATPRVETPKVQAPVIESPRAEHNEATVIGGPPLPIGAQPPGLRRTVSEVTPGPNASNPSAVRSAPGPARPTFQSSAPTPAPQPPPGPRFGLTVLAGPARGQRFKLAASGAQIGRGRGAILFPDDPFISPLHASLSVREGRLYVRDEGSTSGVFVSIHNTETIPTGGTFCTGLRLFRFLGAVEPATPPRPDEVLVYGAGLPNNAVHYIIEEVLLGDRGGRCLMSPGPVITIGQGRSDFSYPNDEGLAPRHCEISPLPDGAMIRDLSGGLGTFVRIESERALKAGDRLRVGQQTLQVESIG